MLWNALENKGFSSCPASDERLTWGVIAAVGGGDGDSAGVVVTYGDFSRQEADR